MGKSIAFSSFFIRKKEEENVHKKTRVFVSYSCSDCSKVKEIELCPIGDFAGGSALILLNSKQKKNRQVNNKANSF